MTLQEAWDKRRPMWAEGTKHIEEGNRLWKEVTTLPSSARVSVWLSISEMSSVAAAKVFQGYTLRSEADAIWHDAVVEVQGPKTKLTWEFDPIKKAYKCTLDSGAVFEP